MHVHRALSDPGVVATGAINNLIAREHPAWPLGQHVQNIKLGGGEMHGIGAHPNLAVPRVNAHLFILNNASFQVGHAARAAQGRFHPRE